MDYKDDKSFIRTIPNDPADDILKPKVLFACINAPSYSSAGQIDGFKKCGYEVIAFDWQHIRYEIGVEDMLERLLVKAITEKPELIFLQFQNAEILDVETAKELSKHGFVINFTEDIREDATWYEEIAPHIGLTVFTNIDDVEKLKAKGINNVAYVPTSYNHLLYRKIDCGIIDLPDGRKWEINCEPKNYGEIIFIGNNYCNTNLNFPQAQERQDMIAFMKKEFGNKFQAYGIGQENRMLNMNECVEAYNNCKIAITHSNFKRNMYMSDRNLNALGCGTVTIQQHFEGIEKMFEGMALLVTWKNMEELSQKCAMILKLNLGTFYPDLIYDYTVKNHTWYNRFEQLKTIIKQLH